MGKSEGGGRGRCRSKNTSKGKGKEESGNGRHHGVSDGGSDVERAGGVAGRAGGTERGREGEGVGVEGGVGFLQLGVVFSTVNGSFGGLSSAEPQVGGTTGG